MVLAVLIACLLVVLFLTIFAVSLLVAFFITRVPFVRTPASDIKFIVSKLGLSASNVIYELGSGDGHMAFLFERLAACRVRGYELGWFTVMWAKLKAKIIGSKAEFVNQNFFKANWSGANIIYCYLFPPLMGKVEEKFKSEMKPGSIAIVRDFPFPSIKPLNKYPMTNRHIIYIYKV